MPATPKSPTHNQPAQHTPGPWNIERPYQEPGVFVGAGGHQALIAKVYMADGHMNWKTNQWEGASEQTEANARLIAAAPEMLDCLGYMQDFLRIADQTPSVVYAQAKVDAMIAKATGSAL